MSISAYFSHLRRKAKLALMMMIWAVCGVASAPISAQTHLIDSLRAVVQTPLEDTARTTALTRLVWELRVIEPLEAITFGHKALGLLQKETNLRKRSEVHRYLGVAYRNIGEYGKASEEVYTALALDEKRGDSLEIGHSLNTLGRIMLLEQKVDLASSYLHRAVALAESLKDEKLLAFCLFSLADLYFTRGEYDLALATAEKVVHIRRKRGEEVYVADVYLAIARGLTAIRRLEDAESYIGQALSIYRAKQIPYNIAVGNNAMATILLKMNKSASALEYATAALRIATSIGAKGIEKEAASLLSEGYSAEGDFSAALDWHKRYKVLNDSITAESTAKQRALLDIEYETKSKEQKITAFEREKQLNILLAVGTAIIVALLVLALIVVVRQYKSGNKENQHLQARAETLADLNDELRLSQLELQESHEQLTQALREIQTQNEVLSDFNQEKNMILGMVSHDLKNPIIAIQGLAEMMANEDFTEVQYKEFSNVILSTSNRMYGLVKNFLDVARAEEGRLRMTLIQFDIGNVINLALQNYQQSARNKDITIHYTQAQQSVFVYADESLVLQILDNLISNAIKYTPPGKEIALEVSSLQILRHNVTVYNVDMDSLDESAFVTCVRVSVIDEGPGLTDLDKTRLFGKFARLSAQPTGGESSTGLGLAITKRLVEMMKGRIWCESEVGFGSRFTFELPTMPE